MNEKNMIYDLIVIGGGPSGMMCAGRAAERGARVLLIEKNDTLGKKLLLTGGGRCNITNADFDVHSLLNNFGKNKKYLYSPFAQFSVQETFDFFEKRGLPLVVEARNRAFPKTQKAKDVLICLEQYMREFGVEIKKATVIAKIHAKNEMISEIHDSHGKIYHARFFALATGGLAAPETGATGDGINFLSQLGHTTSHSNPDLVPLKTDATWIHELSGITWSFMKIRFVQNDRTYIRKTGKILFTHFGISGPLVINSSHEVKKLLQNGPVTAVIDLFPDTDTHDLDKKILKLIDKNRDKKMKNILPEIIFKKIAQTILAIPSLDLMEVYGRDLTREQRKRLVQTLKNLSFPITGTCGMDKAIIADGGVDPTEIDFTNMTSRKYSNLYVLGDILDINRPSGGFSLQICWTTGHVAGDDVGNHINT